MATSQLEELLATSNVQHPPVMSLVINIALAGILSFLLMKVYVRYGKALTNRYALSNNFVPLSLVTAFIISVVRSSLSLSLGLVGALSIIRFRTAIKDPEELVYLFTSVAIGLGIGAGQPALTAATSLLFFGTVIALKKRNAPEQQRLFLTARASGLAANSTLTAKTVVDLLKTLCSNVAVSRLDSETNGFELTCVVDLPEVEKLTAIESQVKALSSDLKISFISGSTDF